MWKILFVEDNEDYRNEIFKLLNGAKYEVSTVENAIFAIEKLQDNTYDLVISDLQMEAMDGIRLMSYVKKDNPATKTIILTGEPSAESEINALSLNVDKYLRKDLHKDVLLKYIEHVLQSPIQRKHEDDILESEVNALVVDVKKHEVFKDGESVFLTNKEFKLLVYMLNNRGYAISREEFIEKFWDQKHEYVDSRVVDSHLKSLRKKLRLTSIVSIRGFGYKWNE